MARPPGRALVTPLADAEVDAMADLVRRRTGLPTAAFYGGAVQICVNLPNFVEIWPFLRSKSSKNVTFGAEAARRPVR